ncbi:Dps family protein [Paraburkholderia sediminicola]|uniref:Dps family protein n=1 Tax=Paraburkholderia sediminicola TaxID=458836 RepID=UPI0038BCD363
MAKATGASGSEIRNQSSDVIHVPEPKLHQRAHELQPYGHVVKLPIALSQTACETSIELLNQILADTMTLRDMYKKHHWQVVGPTFQSLHLLYDAHYDKQVELVDTLAERIQLLGGVSVAMAADVAEMTMVPRPPRGREEVPVQLSRLLEAHEIVILATRSAASKANEVGDFGTNDVLVSDVLRTNELQVWFLAEHLIDAPLVVTA